MGLTASHQCAGFGASVLAHFGRSSRHSSAMGFAGHESAIDLVDQHRDRRTVDDRLVGDGPDHVGTESAKRRGHLQNDRFSADWINGPSSGPDFGSVRRWVATQRSRSYHNPQSGARTKLVRRFDSKSAARQSRFILRYSRHPPIDNSCFGRHRGFSAERHIQSTVECHAVPYRLNTSRVSHTWRCSRNL